MSPKTFVSQIVVAVGAVAAFTVSAGFSSSVSAVSQGVQSVTGLGTTYVDTTTDGGDWYLVGYGASGNVGRIDSQNGTFNASTRTGSATLDASTFVQGATEVAFAWTTAGGSLPTGGLSSYDKAVSFVLPNPSTMTLTGAASPTSGTSESNFSTIGTSTDQSTLRVKNIVGTSGMPKFMFMRNKTLGVRSGTAYGVVANPLINNQLDWTPDGQNYSAIYAGHNGTNGYVTTSGTGSGYVPATMSIWLRKSSECTETSTTNGSRRVVKFLRLGTCTWTPPYGVSNVDVLVVAGGGGAGHGAGGAGGVISQSSVSVSGTVSVVVGQGGAGTRYHYLRTSDNGTNSKFGSLTAVGGGGGGHWYPGANPGASGGSGGGAGADYTNAANISQGVAGQGYGGGVSCAPGYGGAGGGGGAGGVGQNGGPTASANNQCSGPNTGSNPTLGGNGGIGIQSSITGTAEWYGGGGGGGTNTNAGPSSTGALGGQGGGGNGSLCANCNGESGTDGTGGGAGGGDCEGQGGDGGSGIVIISYVQPAATTTTAVTTTTVRSATTTVAPALDIVVNAPVTTVAVGQSAIPKVNSSSTSSTTPSVQGAVGAATTTTTPSSTTSIAPPAPKIGAVAPGEAAVMVGDKKEAVTVKRIDNQVTVTAGELSATLGSLNKDGGVSALDDEGNVRLKPGDTVRIKLAGFQPGSDVEAWLFSTPQLLGTVKVGADGVVVGTFTIPKNVDQGSHRIAVVAKTVDGKPATLTVGIKVGEWKKERSIALWIIVLPIVLAVFGALLLPATRRRKK